MTRVPESASVLPFSKLHKMVFGYFDPENIFLDMKIINFWGELTNSSAKKEALICVQYRGGEAVIPFQPKHRLGRPKKYSFSLSKKTFPG